MFSFNSDPLREEKYTIFSGLIHKHKDRILVELNFTCPVVCEFCTRKRKGINKNEFDLSINDWIRIEKYIIERPEIREVILSGGEPLINEEKIIKILERMKDLKQIKTVRIHTRLPITAPEMVTTKLIKYFKKESDKRIFYLSIHCDCEKELTNKAKECIKKLRNSGVILYSQSVFLKGVNDSINELKRLFEALLELGVRPYYLYHCDKIEGWKKFRVPFLKEKRLIRKLNKQISGLACPILVVDSKKGKDRIF